MPTRPEKAGSDRAKAGLDRLVGSYTRTYGNPTARLDPEVGGWDHELPPNLEAQDSWCAGLCLCAHVHMFIGPCLASRLRGTSGAAGRAAPPDIAGSKLILPPYPPL